MNHIAFISYRHHPLDSAVARELQRLIEQFPIPKPLQKQTGCQNFHSRVFRDKTELPITDDINGDIQAALANSEFLIVICSTHTQESVWVDREIREFLRTHPQNRVLTVLAEGEPDEVIPEILRWNADTPIEPLSCDFRSYFTSKRATVREELPRLIARLLGCPYDTLRQRQREYQTRRLTAIFSAAFACMTLLAAYFFWSGTQIQKNYNTALRNQSLYLSSASLDILASGDRQTAAHLALAALPSEAQNRPWLPQAQYALSQAVNAYATPDSLSLTTWQTIETGSIYRYFFSSDAGNLYIIEDTGLLSCWRLSDKSQLFTLQTQESRSSPTTTAEGYLYASDRVLIPYMDCLRGFDAATGEPLWQREDLWSFQLLPCHDSRYFYAMDGSDYYKLDALTGQTLSTVSIHPEQGYVLLAAISPDDRYLGFQYQEKGAYATAVYDTEAGAYTLAAPAGISIESMTFTADNDLLLCWCSGDDTGDGYQFTVACYRGADLRWSRKLPRVDTYNVPRLECFTAGDKALVAVLDDDAYASAVDYFVLLSAGDGAILYNEQHTLGLHGIRLGDCIHGVTTDGSLVRYDLTGEKPVYHTRASDLPGSLIHAQAALSGGEPIYALLTSADDSRLILCRSRRENPAWQPLTETTTRFSAAEETAEGIVLREWRQRFLLDMETGALRQLPREETPEPTESAGTDAYTALCREHHLSVLDSGGETVFSLTLPNQTPVSCYFLEDSLVAACTDGYFSHYSFTGELLGRTALAVPSYYGACSWWQTEDFLIFQCEGTATVLDLETMTMIAQVEDCVGYLEGWGVFLTQSPTDRTLGKLPILSLADLQALAAPYTSTPLSTATRQQYGLLD